MRTSRHLKKGCYPSGVCRLFRTLPRITAWRYLTETCPASHSHRDSRGFAIQTPPLPGSGRVVVLQLPDEELGYGSETVAHAVDISALAAQDARKGVGETLNFQQKDVVK